MVTNMNLEQAKLEIFGRDDHGTKFLKEAGLKLPKVLIHAGKVNEKSRLEQGKVCKNADGWNHPCRYVPYI